VRVDQIEQRFGDQVRVEWRAYLLRPGSEGGDPAKHDRFVEYTKSWQRPQSAEPSLRFRPWATDNAQPSGSLPAHVAAKAMAEFSPEVDARYHRRLMDAYFAENRTISDPEVFGDLAAECGVARPDFLAYVAEHQLRLGQAAIDDHNAAIEHGVTGVPTVLLDQVLPVQGAQDFSSYEHWIQRLLDRRSQED